MKHFLKETDFDHAEIQHIFAHAKAFKAKRKATPPALNKESWGMLFYKNSTRTRVSFEAGINELGGHAILLNQSNMQLSRGESIADTAKVLSRYLYGLIIRCYEHDVLEAFASSGSIPIVNALSDFLHPCQIYADLFTLAERWATNDDLVGSVKGKKLAFLGDTACNMANSWALGGAHLGMDIVLAGPPEFAPSKAIKDQLQADGYTRDIQYTDNALEAAQDADVIYTDVWVSMGDEAEAQARVKTMQPYQVNEAIMAAAKPNAFFMHCLPAHAGQEVTQAVLDSPQSIIFDEAENRLHAQKAILAALAG